MHSKYFCKYHLILLGALFLLVPPGIDLLYLFWNFPVAAFSNLLEQPDSIKLTIRKIATLGVLGLISLATYGYLSFLYVKLPKFRKILGALLCIQVIAGVGYVIPRQKPLVLREGLSAFYTLSADQGPATLQIRFLSWTRDFLQDLTKGAQGHLTVGLRVTPLVSDPSEGILHLNKRPISLWEGVPLTPLEINNFLKSGQLTLTLKAAKNSLVIYLRNLNGSPLKTRLDAFYIKDRPQVLTDDQAFPIAFFIANKSGQILRVYY